MHFSKCMKLYFLPEKKEIIKKICVPTCTLPKIFRPVTGNTLIFLFGLNMQATLQTPLIPVKQVLLNRK